MTLLKKIMKKGDYLVHSKKRGNIRTEDYYWFCDECSIIAGPFSCWMAMSDDYRKHIERSRSSEDNKCVRENTDREVEL